MANGVVHRFLSVRSVHSLQKSSTPGPFTFEVRALGNGPLGPLTLVLYRMRIVAEAVSVGRDLRAHSIKPFERGRPGFAADAGCYGNSMVGRSGVQMCRDSAAEHDSWEHAVKRGRLRRRMKKRGVAEGRGTVVFGSETGECRARWSTGSVGAGERRFMPQRPVEENEVAGRQR